MALQPTISRYSIDNALALARASALAYDDEAAIRAGIADAIGAPLTDFAIFDIPTHETIVFMAGFEKAIVISFCGTKVLANWLTDGEIHLAPFRNIGLIHRGFQAALESVFPQISQTLARWSGKGRTLWITGHSLGGALAMLLAAYLRFPPDATTTLPVPIAGVYTFGQPRVGTQSFCTACAANFGGFYYRFINNEDIVTRVPPRLLAYWHVDNIRYITAAGTIEDDPAWWQMFLDSVQGGLTALQQLRTVTPVIGLVQDHAIALYIEAIRAVEVQA